MIISNSPATQTTVGGGKATPSGKCGTSAGGEWPDGFGSEEGVEEGAGREGALDTEAGARDEDAAGAEELGRL